MLKKKLILFAFLGAFALSISSCRETKEDKMKDDIEEAAEEVEEIADDVEDEIDD